MVTDQISTKGIKRAFFSLKINKSPGYYEISFNIFKNCFGELCEP